MAAAMMSTEFTEGGRMTVPKEARSVLGIAGGARARASAEPARALEAAGEVDFMARITEAESAAAAGRVRRAASLSAGWRSRILGE